MVPRLLTRSDLVKPIPVSTLIKSAERSIGQLVTQRTYIVKVLSSVLGMMDIRKSFSESRTQGSERER